MNSIIYKNLRPYLTDPRYADEVMTMADAITETVRQTLAAYYDPEVNYLQDNQRYDDCVQDFAAAVEQVRQLTGDALSMMDECIMTTEDILLVVYGIGSNAVLLYRQMLRIEQKYPDYNFDQDFMGSLMYPALDARLRNALESSASGRVASCTKE